MNFLKDYSKALHPPVEEGCCRACILNTGVDRIHRVLIQEGLVGTGQRLETVKGAKLQRNNIKEIMGNPIRNR